MVEEIDLTEEENPPTYDEVEERPITEPYDPCRERGHATRW